MFRGCGETLESGQRRYTLAGSLRSAWSSALLILKFVLPFYLLADLLLYFDLLRPAGFFLRPVTAWLVLPQEAAMALAAGILLNLYGAIAFAAPLGLDARQWTTLAIFLGICHSMPVESAIMRRLGIGYRYSLILRLTTAFLAMLPLRLVPDGWFRGQTLGAAAAAETSVRSLTRLSRIP